MRYLLSIFMALLITAPTLAANETNLRFGEVEIPVSIDSQSMELLGSENLVIFIGEVVAVRGDMTISADRVEVKSTDEGVIESILALGNVKLRSADIAAVAGRADYSLEEESAVLTDDPKVWRGRDAVGGEKITIHFTDNRITVEKARAVLFPDDFAPGGEPK